MSAKWVFFLGLLSTAVFADAKPDRFLTAHIKVASPSGKDLCSLDAPAPFYTTDGFSPNNPQALVAKCGTFEVYATAGSHLDKDHWNTIETDFTLAVTKAGDPQHFIAFADAAVPGQENKKYQLETFISVEGELTAIVTVDFIDPQRAATMPPHHRSSTHVWRLLRSED